ncbi:MAG: hypothetical protein PCFJNLEI_00895 [Verrucomicrobiae bacterium]|nr:hypothetical protein [Verrucomicrobiae bacterium]
MKILHGLLPGQVLQRNRSGFGTATITGTASTVGPVEVRVGRGWRRCGKARQGRWHATLPPLRAGGPYRVEFRIGVERLVVAEIFVGDVWFMAGQSNMGGAGNLDAAPPAHPLVRAFYLRDEWDIARDPLHFLPEAVDAAYCDPTKRVGPEELRRYLKNEHKGVGLGIWFGREMHRRTGVPQALVPCALGGSGLAQWSPRLQNLGGSSLYGALLRRYRKLGQPIAGILWNQGSSDAYDEAVAAYPARMKELVAAVRRDFGLLKVPWLVTQMGRVVLPVRRTIACWNKLQEAQRRLVKMIPHLGLVGAADVELDDFVHFSSAGQHRIARRLAHLADGLAFGNRRAPLAPAPRGDRPVSVWWTRRGASWMISTPPGWMVTV